jgi:hypothetical protein
VRGLEPSELTTPGTSRASRRRDGAPIHYERHRADQTTPYHLIRGHEASFIAHLVMSPLEFTQRLGARFDVLMPGADRGLVKVWQKMNAKRFDNVWLKAKTAGHSASWRHPGAVRWRRRRVKRSTTSAFGRPQFERPRVRAAGARREV